MVLIRRVASFTHCTGSTIHAGIGDTLIDVCLAVGSSPSWSTCTAEASNKILQKEMHVNHSKLITQCMIWQFKFAKVETQWPLQLYNLFMYISTDMSMTPIQVSCALVIVVDEMLHTIYCMHLICSMTEMYNDLLHAPQLQPDIIHSATNVCRAHSYLLNIWCKH